MKLQRGSGALEVGSGGKVGVQLLNFIQYLSTFISKRREGGVHKYPPQKSPSYTLDIPCVSHGSKLT